MLNNNKFYWLAMLVSALIFHGNSSLAQSCDGADGIFPPLSGNTQDVIGDICANSAVIPYRWHITYTNVDDNSNPANVEFFIDWGDGSTQVVTLGAGDDFLQNTGPNAYEAYVTHMFPVTGGNVLCEYIPTVSLQIAGTVCASTAQTSAPVVRWNTDDEITGQMELSEQATGDVVYEICAGDTRTIRFEDNSEFNCIPANFPGFPPNTKTRWFQFEYGLPINSISGTGITINTNTGTNPEGLGNQILTTGNSFISQVVEQPDPIENPTEITFNISVAADALPGEEFHIILNNWNYCNQYEIGGIPTGNLPVTTTAIIRIIDSPPPPSDPSGQFCQFDPVTVTAFGTGGAITWYSDNILTNVVHNGAVFDPVNDPPLLADRLDNTTPGDKTYYVTETLGTNNCEGPATEVIIEIVELPTPSDAGTDQTDCPSTATLDGNDPAVGTGLWSVVSGPGNIIAGQEGNWNATAENLSSATPTIFRWTITNGPCIDFDEVQINRDPMPTVADAGSDISLCVATTASLDGNVPIVGVGVWSKPNAGDPGTITDPSDPKSGITGLVPGTITTFRWTITSGTCGSTSDDVLILDFLDPPANAGPDVDICTANAFLDAVAPPVGGGVWTITNPAVTTEIIVDPTNPKSEVTGLIAGTVYTLEWTVTNGICTDMDIMTLTRSIVPTTPNAGGDDAVCSSTYGPLSANVAVSGLGTWTGPVGVTFSDVNDPAATVSNLPVGPNTLTWSIENGCGTGSDDVIITNLNPVTANAGIDQETCGISTTLEGNDPGGDTGTWTLITDDGSGNIASLNNRNSVFSGTIGFMYELQWDIDNGVCSTQDTVSVRFNQIPIANPGTGGNECDLDFILNGVPTVGTGTWTIQSGPGTISFSTNANDPVATITVSQSGIYEFLWTEDNNGCISSDFITVNFYEQPVADAGVGGDECDLDFILSAVPSIGTGTWSKQSGPGNISFTSGTANDFDATIAVDAFGAYEFLWTEDNSGCTDSDFVTVNFYEQPVADAGPGGDECDLDFVLGAIPSIGTGTWAKQSGPGNISFTSGTANDFDATISVDAYGTYEFLWTEDNNGCTSSDFITVNFYEQPVADAGSDGTFCDNSIALNATPSVGTGTWSYAPLDGTGSFDDANDFKAEFFGDFGKPYTLTWTETNGICTDNASIIVQIDEEPTASNAGVDQIICGTSTTLEGNDVSTGVGTGQWSFALGGNSDGLGVIDTPTLYNSAISGTEGVAYELEWIISNGVCGVSTDDVTIEFEQAIPPAIISGDSLICMGEVATFIISNADPISYNYTWDTSGLPASTTIIPGSGTPFQFISIQFNEPFSNLPLSVQIEDKTSSCTGPVETIQISVENPIADFTADIIEDCSPLEVVFTNNDIQAGTVYTWNFGDGTAEEISSDAVITHTFINTTGISDLSFNVVLTAERTNGTLVCTDAMNEVVTVNPNVVATVTPSVTEGCSPLQVSFENNSIGALTNKWFWREQGTTDENDITDTFFATFHLRNTSTATKVYEVIYQGTRNTCSSEVITEITIHPELVADFTVSPGNNILITDPVITTTNISTDKAVWDNLWEWGDGNTTTEIDPTPYTYTAFGQYELKLTLSDPNTTCTSEKIEIINVEPVPPEVDFTWDVSEGCRPLTVTFTNLSVSVDPDTYQWEFMDERGFVLGTSNLENPIMTFNSAGIITVSLSGSNPLGIVDTETKMEIIEVYEIPTAAFVVSPAIVYLPDQVLYTSNRSTLADMFEWDFDGDGVTDSEEFEPQYLYGSPGVYDIGLIAYNSATTCSDTVIVAKAVEVVDKGTAAVPNAFFPESGLGGTGGTGGPGAGNVVFLPRIKGIGDDGYLMQIFDRWGHLLFQTNDKNEGWNGRNSDGRLYPAGVYVYKLDLTYESGEKTTVVGDVTLIR